MNFVQKNLIPKGVETLYVLGRWENRDMLDNICAALDDAYERCRTRKSDVVLKYDNREVPLKQYLVVLRRRGVSVFQPSE